MPEPLDLRGGFAIETPEQVAFRLERAGLGARTLAALIDHAIVVAVYVGCLFALGAGAGLFALADSDAGLWVVGLMIAIFTFLGWGYFIAFEIAWNGQTPGKRLLGVRVVGDTGIPLTPGQAVIRNVVRVIDVQFAYAVGMIAIFVSREEKRLGDLAAGTVVVSERRGARSGGSAHGAATPVGRNIDPGLLDLVRDYWVRSPQLDARTRHRIAGDLANRLASDLGRGPVPGHRAEEELRRMTESVLGRRES